MLEILEKYPIAYAEFFDWAFRNHGMTPNEFVKAYEGSQALTIISWFGYPQTLPNSREETVLYLHEILSAFDKAAQKYPDKSWDLIKEINRMSYKEREDKHPELFNKHCEPTILTSLKDAFDFASIPQDVIEKIEHKEFWDNIAIPEGEMPF